MPYTLGQETSTEPVGFLKEKTCAQHKCYTTTGNKWEKDGKWGYLKSDNVAALLAEEG